MLTALLAVLLAPAFAIENLHCEISLTDRAYEVAPTVRVRLEPGQVVVRGPLVVEVDPGGGRATWSIRDRFGADQIFADPADSLHQLRAGDRVFLFAEGSESEVLRDGYFAEMAREYSVAWRRERIMVAYTPILHATPALDRPVYATGPLCEAFSEGRHAVVLRTCDEIELRRLRARLTPQIVAYEEHRNSPDRLVDVGRPGAPYERRVFEIALEGALHFDFLDEKNRREGVRINKMNGAIYRLSLALGDGREITVLRPDDRVFLLDGKGDLILEYVLRFAPIGLPAPPKFKADRDLIDALPRARRAVVIRRAGP